MTIVWFLAGCAVGLLLVELAATLFYCLPRAAVRVFRHANTAGLLSLFLRAALYRCIALVILVGALTFWGFSHHRALAAGLSLVLAAYGLYSFSKESRKGLSISFERQAERYAPRGVT